MADIQIKCTVKPHPDSTVERIQELRGRVLPANTLWKGTPAEAASLIRQGHVLYVLVNEKRTFLEPMPGHNGAPEYVRTVPNGRRDDNLLKIRCKNP